jgi:hypothetical protein
MEWKIKQLRLMLEAEQNENGGYGAHLTHWVGTAKPINIDERAIMALIEHYEQRMQDGEE